MPHKSHQVPRQVAQAIQPVPVSQTEFPPPESSLSRGPVVFPSPPAKSKTPTQSPSPPTPAPLAKSAASECLLQSRGAHTQTSNPAAGPEDVYPSPPVPRLPPSLAIPPPPLHAADARASHRSTFFAPPSAATLPDSPGSRSPASRSVLPQKLPTAHLRRPPHLACAPPKTPPAFRSFGAQRSLRHCAPARRFHYLS